MLSLAEQEIFDRYKHPSFAGEVSDADITVEGANQSCGDEVRLTIKLAGETITRVRHTTRACAVCTAAADILAEHLEGKPRGDIQNITPEQVAEWVSVPLSPIRLKCALLPLETLKTTIG